jgi:putative transcription antitermination factor YqgF
MKKQPVPVDIPDDIDLSEPEPTKKTTMKRGETALLPALGIDYGTKFVGIALAAAPLAQPLTIAANNDHLLTYICTLIDDYQIRTVVIGLSERRTADLTHQFARHLKATVSARVVFADETLTTQVVRAKLRAAGRKIKPDERVDHYAAAEVLQDWLDSHERLPTRI